MQNVKSVLVINLERRRDRLIQFLNNCPLKACDINVITAIDGKNLEMSPWIHKVFAKSRLNYDRFKIACAISHINALKAGINALKNQPQNQWVIIFEDDACLKHNLIDNWNQAILHVPDNAGLIYLGGFIKTHTPTVKIYNEFFNCNDFRTACGYAVNKQMIEQILTWIEDKGISMAYDCWLNTFPRSNTLCRYIIKPDLCQAIDFGNNSDV